MIEPQPDSSHCPVLLPVRDLRRMIRLVRALYRLSLSANYQTPLLPLLPESARFDPGHDSVMMGYDFHLTEAGPRLIEINTNAGGSLLAWQAQRQSSGFPTADHPEVGRLLDTFDQEMNRFSQGRTPRAKRLVIIDEEPEKQYLYPEMQRFVALFQQRGMEAHIVDPSRLSASGEGVFLDGKPVDLIYNRHCDFYLESEVMDGIRAAYLAARVCLTPNPRAYGFLADKRRMTLWSRPELLRGWGVDTATIGLLVELVPTTRLLADFDLEQVWSERKDWVFKPVDSFGSRGVVLGRSVSRTRFDALPGETTLVQQTIPPSLTPCPWGGKPMKTDYRIFVYGQTILGVAARIYQGQVTGFQTPGSGYAPVRLVR